MAQPVDPIPPDLTGDIKCRFCDVVFKKGDATADMVTGCPKSPNGSHWPEQVVKPKAA